MRDDADAPAGTGRPGCRGAARTQDNAGGDWDSQTLRIDSDDFVLRDVTVLNDACGFDGGARNFALMVLGDRAQLVNCRIYGQHDTFFTGLHRVYVKDSHINGSVDFLFGAGSAVFEGCEIVANGGHITAHKGSGTDQDGQSESCGNTSCSIYLIRNSRLPAARHKAKADLGRAWRSRATVVYESTWMDSHIVSQGWGTTMSGCKPTAISCPNITFAEHNSSGPGANPHKRVRWSKQLSVADMDRFAVHRVLNGWVPSSSVPAKHDDAACGHWKVGVGYGPAAPGAPSMTVRSAAECCSWCHNISGCKFWTWNGPPPGNHGCYAKAGNQSGGGSATMVSGGTTLGPPMHPVPPPAPPPLRPPPTAMLQINVSVATAGRKPK